MKARVKLTPELIKKLEDGDTLTFKIAPGCDTVEVVRDDEIPSFDEVFEKFWKVLFPRKK